MSNKVDKNKIPLPSIDLTNQAKEQLFLIFENDPTTHNKVFRIQISGKGCSGFTYSTGLSEKREDDFILNFTRNNVSVSLALDPFTAFYLQQGTLDYQHIFDETTDEEGFVVANKNEDQFQGKFFNKNPDNVPPMIKKESTNG